MSVKTKIDYWFTVEPYVFVNITNRCVLLYNTLDGVTIESNSVEVIDLLQETLQVKNCGVILLKNEKYQQKDILSFIHELREKYMGDIIDVSLSKGKPVQLLPYYNFSNKLETYKKQNFTTRKNVLKNLYEVSVYIDSTTEVTRLIFFLQTIQENLTFNIIGDIETVPNYRKLLTFFNQSLSPKYLLCSYKDIVNESSLLGDSFSYEISVDFPIDMNKWEKATQILLNQTLPVEYNFEVLSDEDCLHSKQIIEQFQIEKYRLTPIFTGENMRFFEENVFLTKEDILSPPIMTIKDFFSRQAMNIYDFGKINIMPNGDAYANLNHPVLGNIYINSIYEIVQKEVDEGKSWFRIRNEAPCINCIYQWLCPPPSSYEIVVGRPNLCYVNK